MAIEAHLRRTLEDREIRGILELEDLEQLNRNSPADVRVPVKRHESLWDRIVAEGIASGEFDPGLDQRVAVQAILTMIEDGVGSIAGDRWVVVRDVAELLRDAVKKTEKTA